MTSQDDTPLPAPCTAGPIYHYTTSRGLIGVISYITATTPQIRPTLMGVPKLATTAIVAGPSPHVDTAVFGVKHLLDAHAYVRDVDVEPEQRETIPVGRSGIPSRRWRWSPSPTMVHTLCSPSSTAGANTDIRG